MKTLITTELDKDGWKATTPHQADLEAKASTETEAVNLLIQKIRDYVGPWVDKPCKKINKNEIVRELSGCSPQEITTPPATKPAKVKDKNHGI